MPIKKKFGFEKVFNPLMPEGFKKRRNTPPVGLVPMKAFAVMIEGSESILERAPVHNLLVFNSENTVNQYLKSIEEENRKFYRVEKVVITTESYIRRRVNKAKK